MVTLTQFETVAPFMTLTARHAGCQDSISLRGLVTDLLPGMPALKDSAFGNHPATDAPAAWEEHPDFSQWGAGQP